MEDKKIKILAIDDNPDNLVTLKALIRDALTNTTLLTALNGRAGLVLAELENPDVILLDIIMPEMDGFEVCRRLKAQKQTSDIPVIFVTALMGDKESRILALECGGEGFLAKPIDESELTAQIRAMVRIKTANMEKRDEKERLARLVEEQTRELTKANMKAMKLLDDLKKDIIKRKQAEEEKENSAFRFYSLFDNMTSGVGIYKVINNGEHGKDYIIQDFNRAALLMEGKNKEEIIGKSLYDLRPNIDEYGLIPVFQRVWETGQAAYFPSKVYIDHNFYNWYENNVVKLFTGEIVSIYNDVTDKMLINQKMVESEKKYRQLSENISDVIWTVDLDLNTTYISPSAQRVFGETVDNYINKPLEQKFTPNSLAAIKAILIEEKENEKNPIIDKHRTRIIEVEHYRADGTIIWVSMNISFLHDANGELVGIEGVTRDISERKRMEDSLRESEKRYSQYIDNAPYGVFVADETGQYIEVNKAATAITGYSKEELLRMNIKDISAEDSLDEAIRHFKLLLGKGSMSAALQYKHKNGTKRWWTVDAVKISKNRFLGFSGDITDRKKAEDNLMYLSYHDYLTDLYNRRYFEKALQRLDKKSQLPISFITCDINGLKLINDAFGYTMGDKLIVATARVLQSICPDNYVLARTGGDEFDILMPRTDSQKAFEKLQEIQAVCRAYNSKITNEAFHINISLGYDTKEDGEESFMGTIKRAEDYMNKRKLLEKKSSHSAIISSIKATMLEKSHETEAHAERMAVLSRDVGIALNLTQTELDQLELLATLHDLGKVGLPDYILSKPGKLNEEEWLEIKKHPEIGYRIATSSPELVTIAEFILSHHERWDGKGYPQKLAGHDIPLLSRILAVVDAYDAMTQDRAYRKAMSNEEAVAEINKNAGTQFDPQIAQIFLDNIHSK